MPRLNCCWKKFISKFVHFIAPAPMFLSTTFIVFKMLLSCLLFLVSFTKSFEITCHSIVKIVWNINRHGKNAFFSRMKHEPLIRTNNKTINSNKNIKIKIQIHFINYVLAFGLFYLFTWTIYTSFGAHHTFMCCVYAIAIANATIHVTSHICDNLFECILIEQRIYSQQLENWF